MAGTRTRHVGQPSSLFPTGVGNWYPRKFLENLVHKYTPLHSVSSVALCPSMGDKPH
jgi:hypothetical protein